MTDVTADVYLGTIARNIADNIILSIDKMIAPDAGELKAAAAMNVAAIMSRHAGLTGDQTIELLRLCIAADNQASAERETKKPRKTQGMTELEIELLTALEKANWHLSDFYSGQPLTDNFREKYLEPVISKANAAFFAAKEGQR
jgi:hypothetical protein